MRLYKMELYKLCHSKSFAAGFLFVLFIGWFFFYEDVQLQRCVINGVEYTGFQAIQANRQITEEFQGILTDDVVEQIIEKYGFPDGSPDGYNRLNGNFLNTFVMDYASDGYNNGSDDYRIATKTIPLADTDLGRSCAAAGREITLGYYDGWKAMLEEYGVLMLGVSMLILYIVSVVFSEEEQTGMKPLLFTTKKGPGEDTLAKLAAAFSVSVSVWLLAVGFYLLLYCITYGTGGLSCLSMLLTYWRQSVDVPLLQQSVGAYVAEILLVTLLAVLELCAITSWVSARCHSSFHAVVAAGICYVLPFLGFMLSQFGWALLVKYSVNHTGGLQFNGFTFTGLPSRFSIKQLPGFILLKAGPCLLFLFRDLVYSSPVYLLLEEDVLVEICRISGSGMWHVSISLTIAFLMFLLCTAGAWRRYRRQQNL